MSWGNPLDRFLHWPGGVNATEGGPVLTYVGTFSLLLLLAVAMAGTLVVQAVAISAAPQGRRRDEPSPSEHGPADSIVAG